MQRTALSFIGTVYTEGGTENTWLLHLRTQKLQFPQCNLIGEKQWVGLECYRKTQTLESIPGIKSNMLRGLWHKKNLNVELSDPLHFVIIGPLLEAR